jgi:hypothetical protein
VAVKRLPSMTFCAGLFVAFAFAQPLGTGVISGIVIDSESGGAVRKAVVTLTLQGTPRRWATTRTDGSGRFEFKGLPAGKYDLSATKMNEGTATYGARTFRELGDVIMLGDGETRGAITLRFLHSASVSGHVYDSDGEPVANARVSLLRPGRNLGAPVLVQYRGAGTDDRGEYRFSSVAPGRYYLRVSPAGAGRFGGPNTGPQAMLVDQFYGGARDAKDAAAVHVGGGESLSGFDFHLISEPAVEVRGQVLGVPTEPEPGQKQPAHSEGLVELSSGTIGGFGGGIADTGIRVRISPAELNSQRWTTGVIALGPEHRFETPAVPAGRYRIEAELHAGNKAYGASQIVDLHPGSGEISLTLAPAVDIHGTLRVDGQAPHTDLPATSRLGSNTLRVQLVRPETRQSNVSAEVGADGRFTLEQVLPGEWELLVTPVPPGFLKLANFGEKDVRFTTFEAGSSSALPLNIVVSMHTATIEGEVDGASSDSARSGIVIAPVGPYHNLARFYYGGTTGTDGKFHIGGIAPGKYKVFAIEKMAATNFRNPEAADQLDELDDEIDLKEGTSVKAHPRLIPAERATQALQ